MARFYGSTEILGERKGHLIRPGFFFMENALKSLVLLLWLNIWLFSYSLSLWKSINLEIVLKIAKFIGKLTVQNKISNISYDLKGWLWTHFIRFLVSNFAVNKDEMYTYFFSIECPWSPMIAWGHRKTS